MPVESARRRGAPSMILAVRCTTLLLVAIALLAGCEPAKTPRSPAEIRAEIDRLLPPKTEDRQGWATDIHAAFVALKIEPSAENICSALAVTEQESTFTADPVVPGLGKIAIAEIERRASRLKLPKFVVRGLLSFDSGDGSSYAERLAAVRTERELSEIFEQIIGSVPMGKRLFAGANPVRTGGPMQVSIDFSERYAKAHPYPYPRNGTIRHEVFTRRGGMYFGIAHLLGYPVSYEKPLYRFADFNAGFYASRNAAFQQAVSQASGIALTLDGDLVNHGRRGRDDVGATEAAVRALSRQLEMTDAQIRRDLEKGKSHKFERTTLYERVFELAEQLQHRPLPRAVMPRINLKSPKITRKLTTEWFAKRVDTRYQRCVARAFK